MVEPINQKGISPLSKTRSLTRVQAAIVRKNHRQDPENPDQEALEYPKNKTKRVKRIGGNIDEHC